MEGLGITAGGRASSRREGKRWNGEPSANAGTTTRKGKGSNSDAATSYVVSKIDAGQAVLISDQVSLR